ncbi:hypothetical protein RHGRI_030739 [Rhododendron griersonianum]|uniref:Dilute domain-containing protein n=1 Tax=Rhododendron griersonianum TaxID=479676 RepID=A0AAV6I556_9ERIC|nr:hypothetical protein RHGRI_030739 [Rhododendron griersonianum]
MLRQLWKVFNDDTKRNASWMRREEGRGKGKEWVMVGLAVGAADLARGSAGLGGGGGQGFNLNLMKGSLAGFVGAKFPSGDIVWYLHFLSVRLLPRFSLSSTYPFSTGNLLLRRECCTFSNGEYVKSGLVELEKWIVGVTEEFAGTSWHELNYIRQAVGFLVIHQKRKKSLDEIRQDLCPVVAQMREILNKDSQNLTSNSFLLDDDLSIPFSTEDIYMALPAIDPSLVELPMILSGYASAQFLVQPTK